MIDLQELHLLFRQYGLTLALAESCTGGMIAARVTDIPGCSAWFSGGVVAYSNQVKMNLLRVPETVLELHGAVSEPVARAMAEGALKVIGSDLALSVTGIAGPGGGTPQKPVGTVFVGLADHQACTVEQFLFAGDRDQVRQQTADQAIIMLKNRLAGSKRA